MPTWVQERSYVNQRVQVGVEASGAHGVAVAAGKILLPFSWDFGIEADVLFYGATGRKYDLAQEENMEWAAATMSGPLDFNAIIYPLGSAMGAITPVAHGTSLIAKDWVYTPPVSGSIEPNTFTFQQGDTSTRAEQYTYALFTKLGYKLTRKDATCDGMLITQALTDGITMTGSPTAVALSPIAAKMFNVYLDTTSAGLGVTQLLRVLMLDYAFDGIYEPLWVLNRANLTWPAHIDVKPKATVKIKLESDATGMSLLPILESGATQFLRVQAIGPQIDNSWLVTLGTQASGTFTLTYGGQTTATIAFNATSASVQSALALLSSIPTGTVSVTGSAGGPYTISFTGVLTTNTQALTATFTGLGTPANASLTNNVVSATFQHDMAVKVGKPSKFEDDSGVFANEWELTIVEDTGWGKAQLVTVTNLITAL